MRIELARLACFRTFALAAALLPFGPLTCEAPAGTAKDENVRTLYVALNGDDKAAGTEAKPLRSITAALTKLAGRGGIIQLAAGTYPEYVIDDTLRSPVEIRGPEVTGLRKSRRVSFEGASLAGAANLTFRDVRFTAPVVVTRAPLDRTRGARDITFVSTEFTSPGNRCLMIRDGARNITLRRSWVHDCASGIGGYGTDGVRSSGIHIHDSVLERFTVDGIQFSSWNHVNIVGNRIREARDPGNTAHNDIIQVAGGSDHVRIVGNRITGSRAQLLLIQGDLGSITDVDVINNVFADAGGFGIQAGDDSTDIRFINNTMYKSTGSALLLRQRTAKAVPKITVVNNILYGFKTLDTIDLTQRGNLIVGDKLSRVTKHDRRVRKLGFVDAAKQNFRLRRSSPAFETGLRKFAPARDILGRPRGRRPSIGAYQ